MYLSNFIRYALLCVGLVYQKNNHQNIVLAEPLSVCRTVQIYLSLISKLANKTTANLRIYSNQFLVGVTKEIDSINQLIFIIATQLAKDGLDPHDLQR
ncbi:MAG: hypothetical protein CMK63_04450 [Pseudoalteromonadaceae bacterium]|mgnify:FL=1|nr:hypothetical protein [Pseudoalteromonadaceae bacterium]|tara:strand:- start:78 stop:371 length:294 start_codon:yes stop_codon:yes gene_type:complete